MLVRSPRVLPYVLGVSLRAAARGIWSDVELGVLLDSERIRRALPGTVRGAAWSPEEAFLQALVPLLDPDWRVLEIGCGVGRVSRQIAPRVRELVCTDISKVMVREARRNLPHFRNVEVLQTAGYWLENLGDETFDAVYSHAVFCFFDLFPAIAMLDAARRVLRPGGTCIIDFFTMDRPPWAAEALELARRSAARGAFGARAVRPYTETQIRAMCEVVGFEVTHCAYGAVAASDDRATLLVVAKATRPRPGTRAAAELSDRL